MILVDITVPGVDNTYDFKIDENVEIRFIIEDIVQLICQKEKTLLNDNNDSFLLCSYKDQRGLDKTMTLRDCGINSGDKLLLV